MISFIREEKKVKVNIEHGIYYSLECFSLYINHDEYFQAELLKRQFQANLDRHLARIKQKYYNEGWKQAKAKNKKQLEFYGGWER